MRREFELPEEDVDFLNSEKFKWETIVSSGNWVIIKDFPISAGYSLNVVDVALKIDSGYPISQIDMVYFNPPVLRNDSKIIGALSSCVIDSKNWQRWSRHRTSINPWRPEVDGISTHISLVNYWLEREFGLR
jgi:hypothetical protein